MSILSMLSIANIVDKSELVKPVQEPGEGSMIYKMLILLCYSLGQYVLLPLFVMLWSVMLWYVSG